MVVIGRCLGVNFVESATFFWISAVRVNKESHYLDTLRICVEFLLQK